MRLVYFVRRDFGHLRQRFDVPLLISTDITNERLAYTRDADEEEVWLLPEGGDGARKENISQKVDVLVSSASYLLRVPDTRDAARSDTFKKD